MALIQGQRTTYGYNVASGNNDLQNEKLDISSMLDMLHPTEVPLLTLIGRDSLRSPARQVKHEWLEDEVRGLSATTTDTDLDNTTPGVVVLTLTVAADAAKFRGSTNDFDGPFDIVRISSGAGEELARVTAVSVAGGTISVDRGYASWSTPVNHTGFTKTITIIGGAQSQGLSTVGEARTTTKANKFNYTQIFEDSLKYSATFRSTDKWITRDQEDIDRASLLEVFGELFERSLIFGKKLAPANQDPGTMDGIRATLTTNVYDKSAAALTETHLADAFQDIWDAGGTGERYLFCGAIQKRRINTFLDPYRQAGYSDERLGTNVTRYESPFPGGAVNIVLDRHMPTNEVLIITPRNIGFGPLRGNGGDRSLGEYMSKLASNEAIQYQWIAEMTAEVRLEKTHARIHNLAITGLY